jgi:tetratricopeptide (TPR) repeat protein
MEPRNDPDAWARQALIFLQHLEQADDPNALNRAINLLQRAIGATSRTDENWALYQSILGAALHDRFRRLGALADIEAAVTAGQRAIDATSAAGPNRAMYLSNLGAAYQARFEYLRQLIDLDAAVTNGRAAVLATPTDHPRWARYLANLAGTLELRYRVVGDVTDLDAAIEAGRNALAAAPIDDFDRTIFLSNLGNFLQYRFQRLGRPTDLHDAVEVGRAAVAATPTGHPLLPAFLYNLAKALYLLFEQTGQSAHLDAAVEAGRASVAGTPPGNPRRADRLSNLATLLNARFGLSDERADIEEAVTAGRAASDAAGPDHPSRAAILTQLSQALQLRFARFGQIGDLEDAVAVGRVVTEIVPGDHADRAMVLTNVGVSLQTRYERIGDRSDIDEAVNLFREAVTASASDHIQQGRALCNLGNALRIRYEATGESSILDEAVQICTAAVNAIPFDHPSRSMCLSNLGAALQTRFDRSGELADLEEAVGNLRQAVRTGGGNVPQRIRSLNNLSNALRTLYGRTGTPTTLDEAVSVGAAAVEVAPVDSPDWAACLSNLGNALRLRYELAGGQADLYQAVGLLRQVLAATPPSHPLYARHLTNLATALHAQSLGGGNIEVLPRLDEAIAIGHAAVRSAPAGHPERAMYLYNLGLTYRSRFERGSRLADAEAAGDIWREAVQATSAPVSARMKAGRSWGALAASLSRWPDAADGYAAAVDLMPLLAWRGVGRQSREQVLTDWSELVADATACATAADQRYRTVELLERGRSVLWSQQLEMRRDLDQLRAVHPALGRRLDEIRARLDSPETVPTGIPGQDVISGVVSIRDRDLRANGEQHATGRSTYPHGSLGGMSETPPAPPRDQATGVDDDDPQIINIWVREREVFPTLPLVARQTYTLIFRVGLPQPASVAQGERAIPHKDIPSTGLRTEWVVSSSEVAIASAAHSAAQVSVQVADSGGRAQWMASFALVVPPHGDSEDRRITIVPLVGGEARIDVSVSIDGDLYRYLTVSLTVSPPDLPVTSKAPHPIPPDVPAPARTAAVTSEVVHGVPLRHTALAPAADWQAPTNRLDIEMRHPQASLRSDGLKVYTTAVWAPNCQNVEQQIQKVRQALDKLRFNEQQYFDDVDPLDLATRLRGHQPSAEWTLTAGSNQAWERISRCDELRHLAEEGYLLYTATFPAGSEIRAAVEELQPGDMLHLTWLPSGGHVAHVPWALMYSQRPPPPGEPVDPVGFLGLRLRLYYVAHPMLLHGRALGARDAVTRAHLMYWGQGAGDRVAAETTRHVAELAPWKPYILPVGAPGKPEITRFLCNPAPSPVRLVYFYCRSLVGDGASPSLRFGTGTTADDTVALNELGVVDLPDQPLVFANACGTSAGAPYTPNQLEQRFLMRGCSAFIGTECKVPIGLAARFGTAFFHYLYIDATPAGEALAQARRFFWTEYGNLGGLFYSYVNDYYVSIAADDAVAALSRVGKEFLR